MCKQKNHVLFFRKQDYCFANGCNITWVGPLLAHMLQLIRKILSSTLFFRFDSDSCHPYLTKILRGRAAVGSTCHFSKNRHKITGAVDCNIAWVGRGLRSRLTFPSLLQPAWSSEKLVRVSRIRQLAWFIKGSSHKTSVISLGYHLEVSWDGGSTMNSTDPPTLPLCIWLADHKFSMATKSSWSLNSSREHQRCILTRYRTGLL